MTETKAQLIEVQKEKLAEAKQNAEGPADDLMEPDEPEEGITEAIMEKLKAAGDVSKFLTLKLILSHTLTLKVTST